MTGSLQVKNNKFYIVLQYKNLKDEKKYKWIATQFAVKGNKKKAEMLIPEALQTYSYLEKVEEKDIYVSTYLADWLVHMKDNLEISTYEAYDTYINRHLIPHFSELNLRLIELTPKHIREYYDYKLHHGRLDGKDGGLSLPSVRKHAAVLKQALNDAVILEYISKNPALNVPTPKVEEISSRALFLEASEANRLISCFEGHELHELIFVTLYYGLRRSEVLGLKWSAVDFEKNTLKIQHTVVKNKTVVAKDKPRHMQAAEHTHCLKK